MWRYSLLFAAAHFPLAMVSGLLILTTHTSPNAGIAVVVVFLAAYLVGWQFVNRHKHLFSAAERRRLIAQCLLYLVLYDLLMNWGTPQVAAFSPNRLIFWFVFTTALNWVVLWVAFRYPVQKMMQKRLDKIQPAAS